MVAYPFHDDKNTARMSLLQVVGDRLSRHQRLIARMQWAVVLVYCTLLIVPVALPLPGRLDHIWSNLTLFAQFVFWGIWWPFVLLSMVLVGRSWCGLFCPEGALSEFASRIGRGRATPRWLMWRGWPFAAFVLTTLYGQLISVYQYPAPALLILGGSTVAAVAVGLSFGRNKRVWCRYLCPVNGVFGLLAKLAPVYFRVDPQRWDQSRWDGSGRPDDRAAIGCAPLVPIRTMRGAASCHMCGRCQNFRGAVELSARSPNHEIIHVAGDRPNPWETLLIIVGLQGVAVGAFYWSNNALYIALKQALAERLLAAGAGVMLDTALPWWLLTNQPMQNDVMTLLDGVSLLLFIGGCAIFATFSLGLGLGLATRALGPWRAAPFHHLAQSLIPVAGCGVFLGLSALTVTMLRADGISLPLIEVIRILLLTGAGLWSLALAWSITARYSAQRWRRVGATLAMAATAGIGAVSWGLLFWSW